MMDLCSGGSVLDIMQACNVSDVLLLLLPSPYSERVAD